MTFQIKKIKKTVLSFIGAGLCYGLITSASAEPPMQSEFIDVKPLPLGVKLDLKPSFTVPGMASLNFTVPHVENSCARIMDGDVRLEQNLNILEVEFSSTAIRTFKLKDSKGHDQCGQHSFAQYTLPLDFALLSRKKIEQIRIWNRSFTEVFDFEDLGDNNYRITPVTRGKYFKIVGYEDALNYTQYPSNAFRLYPDYIPDSEDMLLREMRSMTRDNGYKLFDYEVRRDKKNRPYYIILDQRNYVIEKLKREAFFKFEDVDVQDNGRIIPLRLYAGRL